VSRSRKFGSESYADEHSDVDHAFQTLEQTINEASIAAAANPLSYTARHSIKENWASKVDELQKKIAKQLHNDDIKLEPNFEAVAAVLSKSKEVRDDWETNLGNFTLSYFNSLEYYMVTLTSRTRYPATCT
jgi:hypothetical protein